MARAVRAMLSVLAGARSILAFVVPAVLGTAVLALGTPVIGRRRARNLNIVLLGRLGPWLGGFRIVATGELAALRLRPAVIVFNHQSAIDGVVMARLAGADSTGVAKAGLRRHPLLGPMLRLQGALFVRLDGDASAGLMAAAADIRQRKLAVLIAPEGHRSLVLGRFRSGALRLARAADIALVPVVIRDSGRILEPRGLLMHPGQVHVKVGRPRNPQTLTTAELEQLFRDALDCPDPDHQSRLDDGGRGAAG